VVTKGRYQTKRNETIVPYAKFTVVDTTGTTLGARFICATDTEKRADLVASALNFNHKPSDYGYELTTGE
jgi:hypothetical protein